MKQMMRTISISMCVCLVGLVRLYQFFLSPLLGANCRHLPSCSHYAKDALNAYGPLRGSYFAVKRILSCHPWAKSRVDPVPLPLKKPTSSEKVKG